jgi:hypothetical protein
MDDSRLAPRDTPLTRPRHRVAYRPAALELAQRDPRCGGSEIVPSDEAVNAADGVIHALSVVSRASCTGS